jgi:hypothetical protein
VGSGSWDWRPVALPFCAPALVPGFKTNADGSFDMYFGPIAPAGQESNWVETVAGRGFYAMFRIYSPTAPLFDGTWTLPDIEPL